MYANATGAQAAGTYYIQSGASDVSQTIEGNLRVTGNLQVDGNETVGGSLAATSLAAAAAVTGASVAATGAVTGASVAATGAVTGASVAATGAVTGASMTSTGVITAPTFSNSGAVGTASGSGLYGSRVYNVNLTAGVNDQDIGLNGWLNDTVPHLLEVILFATPAVVGSGALAFSSCKILSYSNRSSGQVPIVADINVANFGAGGIQQTAGGTLGSYTINANIPGGAYTGAYTVCVTCLW